MSCPINFNENELRLLMQAAEHKFYWHEINANFQRRNEYELILEKFYKHFSLKNADEHSLTNSVKPVRYKCLLCGRDKFISKTAHNCIGGYRKHGLKWEEIYEI